jgi:hypothetical protein
MAELETQLRDALKLARRIHRGPAPAITAAFGVRKGSLLRVDIFGANFQEGADVELLLSDASTYDKAVASHPHILRPLRDPTVSSTTSASAEFRIHDLHRLHGTVATAPGGQAARRPRRPGRPFVAWQSKGVFPLRRGVRCNHQWALLIAR